MKKMILRIGVGVVVLLVLAILAVSFLLDAAVKRGVETVGSRLTEVNVKLDSVNLSLLSGSGRIKGLVVGNPEPYKTPQAIRVGNASISLQPGSLLSDKVVIRSISVEAPEITFEGGLGGNNLSKILSNVSPEKTNAAAASKDEAGRKLQVDDLRITGARVNVSVTGMGGKFVPVILPDIHLSNLGQGPEGITSAELTRVVLEAIEKGALQAASKGVSELGKSATGIVNQFGTNATQSVDKAGKSLKNLLNR